MRTLKLALAAVAAFAFNANAQTGPIGMGNVPTGFYQQPVEGDPPQGQAFHAGGVAACDGCHVMHNASSGVAKSTTGLGQSVQPWTNVTNMYLLQGSDQSSTCLICHGSNQRVDEAQFTVADLQISGATDAPSNYTPGGDFGWLTLDFAAAPGGAASPGERHGHNVVAADFPGSFDADGLLTAPGGAFTAANAGRRAFACSNCHDPHGRYRMQLDPGPNGVAFYGPNTPGATDLLPIAASGSYGDMPTSTYAVGAYRLLAGQNYAPASNPSYPFPNNPPVAVAPTSYNQNEGTVGEVRVAYGTGMSEWCQNCHTNVHLDGYTTGVAGLRHPAGSDAFLHAGQYEVYNAYVSSGDMTGTNNYTSLVPFEQGANLSPAQLALNTDSGAVITAGPTSAVMCLSCHRAHASAFDNMVRWDQNATFLTDGSGFTGGLTTRDPAVTQAGYYGRDAADLGVYQRSLCNKCHGKD